MIVKFGYYMHDNLENAERRDAIARSAGVGIDDNLMDKIGRPFYEVRLRCTLDTETGDVVILGVDPT